MTFDIKAMRKLLCERLCEDVKVEHRPDGNLMLHTHFVFPDGDSYPFHLSQAPAGGFRLSDHGHTLMHISYEHDIDSFLTGRRWVLLEQITGESQICYKSGVFYIDTSTEKLPESIFRFGQALTRIYDLTFLSRPNVSSTFYEDLASTLMSFVDESKIQRDYIPNVPNAEAYSVDYRIEGKNEVPLFVYGILNRDKAHLATIKLGYFHKHNLKFESIIIFRDLAEIQGLDIARLSDVGGEMISSLESSEDLNRKLLKRVAA